MNKSDIDLERIINPGIEFTERIYNSELFLDCLVETCDRMRKGLEIEQKQGEKSNKILLRLYKENKLIPYYIKNEGTLIYFKKSKLPFNERDIVKNIFNFALDMYRRNRNAMQQANRDYNRIKNDVDAK